MKNILRLIPHKTEASLYKRSELQRALEALFSTLQKFYKRFVLRKVERGTNFVRNISRKNASYARYSRESEFRGLRSSWGSWPTRIVVIF